ncbi:ABC transporter substrate-binding protein [Desulfovibrio sp. JC010]|uniref:substrate-binding periplasmic protein n=1 Tax=Desulfovibrio sp. JC010 TaxID=2593641 RepID=UPI0013D0D76C|nr:transporter substrate-binding domain-containing protein [Desulfovibrio sp. JC010]NDV28123.1 amino acid ABC transporter substrate-binding protein [Desulfovibrio sp. JC010]
MRLIYTIITTIFFVLVNINVHAQSLDQTVFMTELLPPYNYIKDNALQGTHVDILLEALAAVNVHKTSSDIKIYPWARAYKKLISTPNTCTLSTIRSPKREKVFKWAGPIGAHTCSFIKKTKNYNVNTYAEIKRNIVGTIRDSVAEESATRHGYRVDQSSTLEQLVKKIERNRISVIFSNADAVFAMMSKLGINKDDYIVLRTLNVGEIYFACNIHTDDSVIKELQKGIDLIRAQGIIDKIINGKNK